MTDERQDVRRNSLGQPIGDAVPDWSPRPMPPGTEISGRYCRLEPLDPKRHAEELFAAYAEDHEGRIWTYMPYGPFESPGGLRAWMERDAAGPDPMFYAIRPAGPDGRSATVAGVASYLRIAPAAGSIEVGHINYAPRLQRTVAATEAMFLMMHHVFAELGYRRYEWKCDGLNAASRSAARRLGFTFEGVFRQATVYKGRNRDTAWYAVIDRDWPALEAAYMEWLAPANFKPDGGQRVRLSALTEAALSQ